MKILIVEDDAQDIFLVKEYLSLDRAFSCTVSEARTLGQAAAYLSVSEEKIDLILLDLHLPDSQGLGTFQKIKAASPGSCIILLTGLDDAKLARDAIAMGAQDYLVKQELTPAFLVRSITYAIQREKLKNEIQHLNKNLERLVSERTAELSTANKALKEEIRRNQEATKELILSESKLTAQSKTLEKKNTALKELLHQFEVEKKSIGKKVRDGIEEIIQPILARMKVEATAMDQAYITLIEDALKEIIVSDPNDMSRMTARLTAKETQVYQMVKSGMQSKEIARLLNISYHTVNRHRYSIRKKLGLGRSPEP